MTDQLRKRLIAWRDLVVSAAVLTGAATTVFSMAFTIVFTVWGAQILAVAGVATSDEMAAVKEKVDDLLRRIVILARPDQIAHYRDAPEPLGGECYIGRECTIVVFAERDLRATDCKILPRETQLVITQDARTFPVPIQPRGPGVNLGTAPQTVEPTFLLPRSLEPGSVNAIVVTHYEGCLWQTDGQPPATQESPRFKIQIKEWPGP